MMHKTNSNRWMMTKAVVLPALMALAVVAFAKPKVESISATENENILPADDKTADTSKDALIRISNDGKVFIVNMPVGTLVENQNGDKKESYTVKQPIKTHQFFDSKTTTVKLDGKVVDIQSLTKKSRSILKKVVILSSGREINLITTPVQITTSVKDDKIYDIVEENAQFPGGDMAMYKWIGEHLKYPEECRAKSIQGRVMIQFVVNKDGSIPDIKVLKSPHSLLSEEAIRVVKAMPFWKPAKVKGEVVRSTFRLPINFRIPDTEKKVTITGQGKPSGEVTTITGQGKPSGEVVDDGIFDDPEENASFPGGEQAMFKWMADNLKYPKECMEKGIQGRVNVQFTIEKDGSITNVKVLRSPDDALAQEAVRMVSAMPKWNPAKQGEKAVRSFLRLPIMFRLSSAQTEQKPNN